MLNLIFIALVSLSISLIVGSFLYKSDLPEALIDRPNKRKIHTEPTPLVGGITIIFTMIITVLFFRLYTSSHIQQYIIFSIYFFFTGLFDDLFKWNYKKKFLFQLIGVITFTISISDSLSVLTFSTISTSHLILNYILVAVWILLIINAFNFFDGINFLAGSISIIFFSSYFIFFQSPNNYFILRLLLILIFSTIGFLIYNRAPAKMFLGDAGSMYLGFSLAAIPLILPLTSTDTDLTFTSIVLFILISDTAFVMVNRILKHKNPFYPDKTHLHHQLLNLNFRNRYVVLIIIFGSILHSILAINYKLLSIYSIISLLAFISIIFIITPRYFPQIVKKYNLWGIKKIYDKAINKFKK